MKATLAKDIIGTISLIFNIIFYIPVIVIFLFRRKTQPLRHRSPCLVLITLISSFLSGLAISLLFYLDLSSKNEWKTSTCKFYSFSINVLHFTLILPYIFRLVNVFNFDYVNINNFERNKLTENYYLKIIAIIFTFLIVNFTLMQSIDEYNNYFPLDIEVCCRNNHISLSLIDIIWFFLHLLEVLVIFYYITKLKYKFYKVRPIKDEFNISDELIFIGITWLGFETVFLLNNYNVKMFETEGILLLNLTKNYLIFIITGLIPIIRSYQRFYLPICTTRECASNFNLLLMNEKTFNSFYFYLRDNMAEGAKLLNFWIDINLFRHNQRKNSKVQILATDIYDKYIKENAELYIDFPSNLLEGLHKSYLKTEKSLYNDIFDDLCEYVYDTLNDYYFPAFKNSEMFRNLQKELENDEILYSRLVQSKMISTEISE